MFSEFCRVLVYFVGDKRYLNNFKGPIVYCAPGGGGFGGGGGTIFEKG